jgi:hypothetical protein
MRGLRVDSISQDRNEDLLIDQFRLPGIREHEHNAASPRRGELGDSKSDPIIALVDNVGQRV